MQVATDAWTDKDFSLTKLWSGSSESSQLGLNLDLENQILNINDFIHLPAPSPLPSHTLTKKPEETVAQFLTTQGHIPWDDNASSRKCPPEKAQHCQQSLLFVIAKT